MIQDDNVKIQNEIPLTSTSKAFFNNLTSPVQPSYLQNMSIKLYHIRKLLLEKFALLIESHIFEPNVETIDHSTTSLFAFRHSGLKSIAFFQCILSLMSDLNPKEEQDKKLLDSIIQSFLNLLNPLKVISNQVAHLDEYNANKTKLNNCQIPIYLRTPQNEIMLICLRTLSILLSKSKYQRSGDNCNFIIQTLLNHLCQFNMIDVCKNLMKYIYFDHWKKMISDSGVDLSIDDANMVNNVMMTKDTKNNGLMKYSTECRYHDELAPYFVRDPLNKDSFVIPPPLLSINMESASSQFKEFPVHLDLFDNYTELLTEILIRLPYQMKKLCLSTTNGGSSSNSQSLVSFLIYSHLIHVEYF